MPLPTRQWWDDSFPTFVRYTGLLTTVVCVGFSLAGFYVQAAPGFVAATGLILYKTVRDAARSNGNGNGWAKEPNEPSRTEERWSHLP